MAISPWLDEPVQFSMNERLRNERLQEDMQARDLDRKLQQYATAYGMSNSQFQKVFHEKKPTNKVLLLL